MLAMTALPAVLVLRNCRLPALVMLALPAVLLLAKFRVPPRLLAMTALPAVLLLAKPRKAPALLVMVLPPAVVPSMNTRFELLVTLPTIEPAPASCNVPADIVVPPV